MKILAFALLCVLAGCGRTDLGLGEDPWLGVDGGRRHDAEVIDDGSVSMDAGGDSGLDGGGGFDGGFDAGPPFDAGPVRDAMVDADVSTDAAPDADRDRDAEQCSGLVFPVSPWGTPDAPYVTQVNSTGYAGTIDWRGRGFFRFTDATPGQHYLVIVTQGTDLTLSVFADDMTFSEASCTKLTSDPPDNRAICDVLATHSTFDVSVDAHLKTQWFNLYATAIMPAEGSAAAPVPIAIPAADIYEAVASPLAPSFYEITGLTSGQLYDVSAFAYSDEIQLTVYDNAQFAGDAFDAAQGTGTVHAFGTPIGTSLFVELLGLATSTTVALNALPETSVSEGTREAPIQLSGLSPQQGELGWAYSAIPGPDAAHNSAESFYELTDLSPGTVTVNLSGPEDIWLYVYGDDLAHEGAACAVQTSSSGYASCTSRITGTSVFVMVTAFGGGGGPIELSVSEPSYVAHGTQLSPQAISYSSLPVTVAAEPSTSSYFKITGLTPRQFYIFDAEELAHEEGWITLYNDSTFSTSICNVSRSSADQCTVAPVGETLYGQLHVAIGDPSQDLGTAMQIGLRPIVSQSEGLRSDPIVVECSNGVVAAKLGTNGVSYYEIRDLEQGMPYNIEVFSSNDVSITVFGGRSFDDFDGDSCAASGGGEISARCVAVPSQHSLFVRVQGLGADREIELRMAALPSTSEGEVGAPIAIDVATGAGAHSGRASPDRPSYYELANLEQDVAYLVRVASVHEELGMLAFHAPSFESSYAEGFAKPGQPLEIAVASDPASGNFASAYFTLELLSGSEWPSDLNIDVIKSPIQSEGVVTPVPLTLDTPHQGTVDGARPSEYELSGLTALTRYALTISSSASVVPLVESPSGGLAVPVCMLTGSGLACTFYAPSTTAKLRVVVQNVPSATFTLTVSAQ